MKKEEKKRSVGRPKMVGNKKERKMIYITDDAQCYFKMIGNGNFSLGIMLAYEKLKKISG